MASRTPPQPVQPVVPVPARSRRDRKRRTTRSALIDAALELFEERGIAATTIEDITERADVGRRTFFRHFPSKEAVLFPDPEDYHEHFATALNQQEPPITIDSVINAFVVSTSTIREGDLRWRRARLVHGNHDHIAANAWHSFATARTTIAGYIASRAGTHPDDPHVQLATSVGLLVGIHAYLDWTADMHSTTLSAEFAHTYARLGDLVARHRTLGPDIETTPTGPLPPTRSPARTPGN